MNSPYQNLLAKLALRISKELNDIADNVTTALIIEKEWSIGISSDNFNSYVPQFMGVQFS